MPVLVAVRDLMFRSKFQEAAARTGVDVRFAPRDRPLAEAIRELGAGTVLADLNEPGALDALRGAAGGNVRAVGWLGHLQQDLMDAARAAGVEVLTRGQLVAKLDGILRGAA